MKKNALLVTVFLILLMLLGGCSRIVRGVNEPAEILTEQAPAQDPEPEPEPAQEPESAPEPEPRQEPEPAPEPKPAPEPEPAPAPEPAPEPEAGFDVFFFDVGQGDAALVICDGETMLINGGSASDSSRIFSTLKNRGIAQLEYVAVTSPQDESVGGLAGALHTVKAKAALSPVTDYDSDCYQDFLKYLDAPLIVPETRDAFPLGSAEVTAYPLNTDTDPALALRIVYGDTSFLFVPDTAAEALPDSTVLEIVGGEAVDEALLQAVSPETAVISADGDALPVQTALDVLRDIGASLYRTDMHGDIFCTSDGKQVTFETQKTTKLDPFLAAGKPEAPEEPDAPDMERELEGYDYVANKNSKKFHIPSCSSVDEMKPENRWYFTGTRDELIEMGYQPCKRCKP